MNKALGFFLYGPLGGGTFSVKFGIYICQMTIFRGGGGGPYIIFQPIFYNPIII